MSDAHREGAGTEGTGTATYLAKDEETVSYPRGRTALLVIDPVNDFLSEGGADWENTRPVVERVNVVENLKRAIEGARERNIPVLFGPMAFTEEDYEHHQLHRRSAINRIMFEKKMFQAGSWGADFHPDLRPRDEEIVLLPHKSIDVFETDLPGHLKHLGTTHLVIAGMTANLCCESTGRHAMEHGYDVTYLSDAVGADNMAAYEAAVKVNYPLIANAVLKVEDFLQAYDAAEIARAAVQPGDTVRGSDQLEIGSVKEVVTTGAGNAHLVVPRGLLVHKDVFIPLDAVVRRAGTDVYISVPRLLVPSMPWDDPPSMQTSREKRGLPADQVDRLYGSRSPSASEPRQD
ncbi:MAG TPA: isochorismatase family cysteine hydrolase [Deinococcales bacterium]|nr:isochorismatase family cysteine hydrolase [Deinococcales bacterium]